MPSMLEQAIIDANALREAAMQTAESAIVEKYSFEVKEAVEKLLEQPEDEFGLEPEPPEIDALDQAPPAAAEDLELCPCPDDEEAIEMEFSLDDLRKIADEMEMGEPAPAEDLATEFGAEGEEEEEDKSKGKHYDPVTLDSRQSGARLRHYSAELGGQVASSSDRNLFKGLSDLKRLASLDDAYRLSEGHSPDNETTYSEEDKIFQINNETKRLIEGLELKDEEDEAQ